LDSLIKALNLSSEKLSVEEQKQLHDLLEEFSDVFALFDAELGCTNLVKSIPLILAITDLSDGNPIEYQ
jgi:hypothetical protein